MLQTLTTAAATLLILLACHYLYRASPQQQWPGAPPDPVRARRLAWRYALAALLLNALALGGYGIAVSLAVAMTALGLMPLIPLLPPTTYGDTHKILYKARRRRQYAFVRRGGATPYRAL